MKSGSSLKSFSYSLPVILPIMTMTQAMNLPYIYIKTVFGCF